MDGRRPRSTTGHYSSYDRACSHRSRRSVHVLDYVDNNDDNNDDNDCGTDYHANDSRSPRPHC